MIILTTNKTFGEWGKLMGDNAIASATLDRLLHHAEVIIMKGESYRIKKVQNLDSFRRCRYLLVSKTGNSFPVNMGNINSVLTLFYRSRTKPLEILTSAGQTERAENK